MKNPKFRRILAYLLDLFIVSLLVSVVVSVLPKNDESVLLQKKYNDVVVDYQDKKIDINEAFDKLSEYNYEIIYYGYYETFALVVITILYFIVLPYFYDGKTLGKNLFKIKVINSNGTKVSLNGLVIRSLFNLSIIKDIGVLILITINNRNIFDNIYPKINSLSNILLLLCFLFILYKSDGKGLHDIVSKTMVVDMKKKEKIDEAIIVER